LYVISSGELKWSSLQIAGKFTLKLICILFICVWCNLQETSFNQKVIWLNVVALTEWWVLIRDSSFHALKMIPILILSKKAKIVQKVLKFIQIMTYLRFFSSALTKSYKAFYKRNLQFDFLR
jgi:hypothetical protein